MKDVRKVFSLWAEKSIFDERLTTGWLATLTEDRDTCLTFGNKAHQSDVKEKDVEAVLSALTVRREALESEDYDYLERKCRMNGLPRVRLVSAYDLT